MASTQKNQVRKRRTGRKVMAEDNTAFTRGNEGRKFLDKRRLLNTYVVIILLVLVVLVGSAIRALSLIPANVVPDSRNVWNQVFNKWAWLWTLIVTTPNCILECFIRSSRRIQYLLLSIIRVYVLGTATWSFWTNFIMPKVQYATSEFTTNTTDGQPEAIDGTGFDISGHAFLLLLSFLIIQEEVAVLVLRHFYRVKHGFPFLELNRQPIEAPSQGNQSDASTATRNGIDLAEDEQQTSTIMSSGYFNLSYVILYTLVIIFAGFIQLLWVVMVFQTSIFFHTFLETISGSLIAFTMWFIIYKCLHPLVLNIISRIRKEDMNDLM